MGHNLYTIDLGCNHVPGIHDRNIRAQAGIHYFLIGDTPPHRDSPLVMVYHQDLRPPERAR